MYAKIALRDLLVIALTVALWHGLAETTRGDGLIADFLGLMLGALAMVLTVSTRTTGGRIAPARRC